MANDARNSMTKDNKVYRRLRINGREFKLIPRSDGRFNLISEGQRGAAGSTAIVARKEGKQIIDRLRSIESESMETQLALTDERSVSFEAYFEGSSEDATIFEGELIPDYTAGNIDDVYSLNSVEAEVGKEVEVFRFDSTPEGDVFVGDEMVIRYPAGAVAQSFDEKTMMDGDVEFTDESLIPDDLKEQFNRGEKITLSDVIKTFAVTGVLGVSRYGDKKLNKLHNSMQSYGLENLHKSLMEIRQAAKNDLIGAPIMLATGGAIGLTRKAAKLHNKSMQNQDVKARQDDAKKTSFYRSQNQKAWSAAKTVEAAKIFEEEKKPLLEELNILTEQVTLKKDLAAKIRIMESHSLLRYSDEELASMKREAAANRDFYKLAELKAKDERIKIAKAMYVDIRQQYNQMPDLQEFTRKVTETKQKIRAVDSKIVKTRNTPMTKNNAEHAKFLPYSLDSETFNKKINYIKGADLRNSIFFALMGGAKVISRRNRYLRLADSMA